MFYIAVCDDDREICAWMEELLATFRKEANQAVLVEIFNSGEELCSSLKEGKGYDLIFLDIELKEMNGVSVGSYIRNVRGDYGTVLIYISAHQEYAMELFQNNPSGFLIKPLVPKKVIDLVRKSMTSCCKYKACFHYNDCLGHHSIAYKDIISFSSSIRQVILKTQNGTYEFYGTMKDIEKSLPSGLFIKIHQSHIVNWLYVKTFTQDEMILNDGTTYPISQSRSGTVRKEWVKREGWF